MAKTNKEQMQKEREILTKNLSFNLLGSRNGNLDKEFNPSPFVEDLGKRLNFHGGYFQQNREIKDKQKSLKIFVLNSYIM